MDDRLADGQKVLIIGPASEGSTFMIGTETEVGRFIVNEDGKAVYLCPIHQWGYMPFERRSLQPLGGGQ